MGTLRPSITYPLLPPCSSLLPNSLALHCPLTPWAPGTFLGPQETLGAFCSLRSSVRLRGLVPLTLPHLPSPPHPLPPEPPWAPGTFLGPKGALGAFRSLRQLWVFSQTQGPCSPCSPQPLAPSCPLAPSHPLSLPGTLGLRKPWEPSKAFRLRGLAPNAPPFPASPPSLPLAP